MKIDARKRFACVALIVAGILIARRAPLGPAPGHARTPEPPPLLEA
jgi:hypothetical protein